MIKKTIFIILIMSITSNVHSATQQIIIGGFDDDLSASATEYYWPSGGGNIVWSGTEIARIALVPANGTFDDLRVSIGSDPDNGASTQSFTFTLRLDQVGTSLGCAISDGSTSCTDSDSFSVTAGQQISLEVVPANTPTVSNARWSMTWNPTTSDESIFLGGTENDLSTTATDYLPLHQGGNADATSGDKRTVIPTPGTIKDLYVEMETAPGAGTTRTFTLGSVDCTISNTETTCNSASDTQAVTAGQTYELTATLTGTPAASKVYWGAVFDPTTQGEWIIAQSSDSNVNSGAVRYNVLLSADQFGLTTETDAYQLGQAGTFATAMTMEDMYVVVDTAPGAGNEDISFTVNVGGVGSSLTCTIADTATACNVSASVSIANDDFLDLVTDPTVSTGSNPNTSPPYWGLTGYIPPSAAATRRVMSVL